MMLLDLRSDSCRYYKLCGSVPCRISSFISAPSQKKTEEVKPKESFYEKPQYEVVAIEREAPEEIMGISVLGEDIIGISVLV
jgi:hypothetical protein